jgi:hypothetical protein
LKIHFNVIFHLRLGLPSGRLPSGLPTRNQYAPLFPPIRAVCPARLILLDLITRIIFGDEYRSLTCHKQHYCLYAKNLVPNNKKCNTRAWKMKHGETLLEILHWNSVI